MPDLPVDEAEAFDAAAAARGIDAVLLAAPGRRARAARRRSPSQVAWVRLLRGDVRRHRAPGIRWPARAHELVTALRPLTDLPLLVGVGIGTPDQAAEAGAFADGVIVGSALMARLVQGDRDGMLGLARAFREALPPADRVPRASRGGPVARMHVQADPTERLA